MTGSGIDTIGCEQTGSFHEVTDTLHLEDDQWQLRAMPGLLVLHGLGQQQALSRTDIWEGAQALQAMHQRKDVWGISVRLQGVPDAGQRLL
jgi:hypothetical protein